MTYNEALEYIHSVDWKGSRPGLERISVLCEMLGHPENDLKFIHIAGTNGKGSVSKMLACILEDSGYRTGLFTSPYIERFNERIMINGEDIPDDDLAEVTEYVKQYASKMDDSPTEFELITAIAFEYYKRQKVDYVVLECGLGGRLDSTNVITTTELSVITGIDLDHTAILGPDTASIAAEKAGIIKPGIPVVFGEGDADAERVIRETAEKRGCAYVRTDFGCISDVETAETGLRFSYSGRKVSLTLNGIYQTRNAATVLTSVEILRKRGISIPEEAVNSGISRAAWKARFETLSSEPLVIYDGAHNPQGINAACESIRTRLSSKTKDGRVLLVMGVMADKNHAGMIKTLSPLVSEVYAVLPQNSRSLDPAGIKAEFEECGVKCTAYENLSDGVHRAMDASCETGIPLVCLGSLYMYADVKTAVKNYIKK